LKVLFISANTEHINMPVMPLGLACVAEATKRAGHEVTMVDLMVEQAAHATLETAIAAFQPACIGLSVRNIDDQEMEPPKFLWDEVRAAVNTPRR